MKNKFFSMFDYFLITVVYSLIIIGILFIYSSNINQNGFLVSNEHLKQIGFAVFGFFLMIAFAVYDYRKFDDYALILYILINIVLIYTKFFGLNIKGASSWIGIRRVFTVQPSEFAKVVFIIFLARYLYRTEEENQLKRFIIATGIMLLPMGLILIQPDLGSASVFIPIFLFMCFFAGIPLRYINYVLALGLLAILLTVLPIWNTVIRKSPLAIINILTNMKLRFVLIAAMGIICLLGLVIKKYFHGPKYTYWIIYVFSIITFSLIFSIVLAKILKPHQITRLIIFMDPYVDAKGAGWHIIQSRIAIGSGGAFGQSYLQGTQSHLQYLPEQSTDFIFSILSEELGFIGCFLVFVLYMFILIRILFIIRKSPNKFGVYICSGIFGMLMFHFFLNIGMVMGIMPVTGVPLLFLSYGGSSLMASLICIGLIQSVNYRKNEFI